jgi:hypothetical protein
LKISLRSNARTQINNNFNELLAIRSFRVSYARAGAVFFGPDTYRFPALIRKTLATEPALASGCIVDVGCGAGGGASSPRGQLARRRR